jgi:hypothetical protein
LPDQQAAYGENGGDKQDEQPGIERRELHAQRGSTEPAFE